MKLYTCIFNSQTMRNFTNEKFSSKFDLFEDRKENKCYSIHFKHHNLSLSKKLESI